MLRKIVRWVWFGIFFGQYRWYRKLHGGRWERWMIDFPVCSTLWLYYEKDDQTPEPLARGNCLAREDYP